MIQLAKWYYRFVILLVSLPLLIVEFLWAFSFSDAWNQVQKFQTKAYDLTIQAKIVVTIWLSVGMSLLYYGISHL